MTAISRLETTRLLHLASSGDEHAADRLLPVVYDELHAIAERLFRLERPNHTLQPTVLVHEAYIRLIDQHGVEWEDRAHFLSMGARMIRRVLIDHARRHRAQKRGGGQRRITLSGLPAENMLDEIDLLALDEALERLQLLDSRQAMVVELKFFAGMTDQEAAVVLGVSDRTVRGDWSHARSWLKRELSGEDPR